MAARPRNEVLEITELSKTYPGSIEALRSISFQADRGIFGLLGPNGAGKSTLMRILATLQLPDKGEASLGELDLIGNAHEARKRIGYLPQEMGTYQRVTAREMLNYLAGLKGIGPAKEREYVVQYQLDRVNLTDVADQRVDTYSGGMRQRFGIAAAFLGDPELVIIDEPTAGLDPTERRRFQCMLAEAAQDCVMVISSHIVEDIAGLCQKMALINQGEIALIGSPQQLTESLDGRIWTRRIDISELPTIRKQHNAISWRPKSGELAVRVVAESDESSALHDQGFRPCQPDLEDLYAYHTNEPTRT
ncbi:MAG: ATP-binding cassette domain-containing protein [Pseudomonadota bacterium]